MCWANNTQRKVESGGLCLQLSDSEKFGWREPSGHFLTSVCITVAVDKWESYLPLLKLTEILCVVNVTCQWLLKSLWVMSWFYFMGHICMLSTDF